MKIFDTMNRFLKTTGPRLILGLFFISSLMVLLISGVLRTQMYNSGVMLAETTQNHLVSAAQALAEFISPEELSLYHTIEDTKTEAFQELKHRLVAFAENHNILYAYFWRYYGNNQLQFIVDNDFDPDAEVGPWVIIDIVEDYLALPALAGNIVVSNLGVIVPTWDGLITAYAPVFDRHGNIRSIAGVDILDRYLYIQRRDARRMTLLLALAIPFSLISGILNLILYRRRAKQIEKSHVELSHEKNVIQTMKDNLPQGILLMDRELKILPLYSRSLIQILSYYDSELEGRNFLDIISTSLSTKQLQIMQDYFDMIFSNEKSAKLLEEANPISEFEYKIDDRIKILTTRFQLIDQIGSESVIIGVIQDISREKEFEMELQLQREAQELEMKNMFDVIQIDPMVFHDFIEEAEANFNYINSILKDKTLTEKQVITKFYQNIHAIKANALILGLESFSNKLHALEDDIKAVSAQEEITVKDTLSLAVKLELIMQDKDAFLTITKKIETFKSSNQIDSVLVHSLNKAVEKISAETQKNVELEIGYMDISVLESKLRKPIKDILFQCVRNSIYHGIEPAEERRRKNKKPQGLLSLSIRNVDGMAEIIFSDDGQGLDLEKIKKKYLETRPGVKEVSRKALLASIFDPEFSTANMTSTVAGRGIGLSLVKDLVKENNGTININSSESGLTLKFILALPA